MLSIEQIRQAIKSADVNVDAATLPETTTFVDAGLDSLDFYNIVVELQEMTGITVPDQDIDKLGSISGVQAYFADKQ